MIVCRWSIFLSLALGMMALSVQARAAEQPAAVERVRVTIDGAGPSHLFWVGPLPDGGDRIAIADPLFAAIRLYDVARPSAAHTDLESRLRDVGVCALPISLRPWRIHQLRDAILIESMPDPGEARQHASAATMTTTEYRLERSRLVSDRGGLFAGAGPSIAEAGWDPAKAPACGSDFGAAGRPGAGMPERARRGVNNPNRTIALWNMPGALSPTARLQVRSPDAHAFAMLGARELEPVGDLRVVQTSEGVAADDGIVRVRQRLVSYSKAGRPLATLTFDDRFVRAKVGLRPVMVLPDGEVLAMGRYVKEDSTAFRLVSCGTIGVTASASSALCDADQSGVQAMGVPDLAAAPVNAVDDDDEEQSAPGEAPTGRLTAKGIFANALPLEVYDFNVVTTGMPAECRDAGGCDTGQRGRRGERLNFVPIRGVRLTRGLFKRTGMPYAQADVPGDIDRLEHSTPEQRANALAEVMTPGTKGIPGNLMDNFVGDMGVDCSALVQVAFGARKRRPSTDPVTDRTKDGRLSTEAIQNFTDDLLCSSRVATSDRMRPGDAVNLNVTGTTHHVMLFATHVQLDGASDSWLMLEAASGCDGVCWSVYDPSFFNGWGIYRAQGRSDLPCPRRLHGPDPTAVPIPAGFDDWSKTVGQVPPLTRPRTGRPRL